MTHAQLSSGQQTAQTAHAIADFALHRNKEFLHWHQTCQYIVVLQASSPQALEALMAQASLDEYDFVAFREPDLAHQLTSIAFTPHEHVSKYLRKMPLAGKHFTNKGENNEC